MKYISHVAEQIPIYELGRLGNVANLRHPDRRSSRCPPATCQHNPTYPIYLNNPAYLGYTRRL
jgi:hypothetical protein